MEDQGMYLPPGFRFYPTDEEIITNYLSEKVVDPGFMAEAIGEADMNKCEPWELPSRAKMGEKEWYFFCQNDKKYPTGSRTNRATASGYWKATGKDKEITKGKKGQHNNIVGMKKTLVFYKGRAPNGTKTNWVMHEFRLEGSSVKLNNRFSQRSNLQRELEWVVCKIFHKGSQTIISNPYNVAGTVINSKCHKPNMISTNFNFNTLVPLPDLPGLLPPASNGIDMGHDINHHQQLVHDDATKWYNNINVSPQLYDDEVNYSGAMMGVNWSF